MGYDAELRRHNEVFRRACAVRPEDRVLDVGCGSGETTRQAAQAAHAGSVLGVDVSAVAVEQARELARGLDNVAFEQADAQQRRFPPGRFDLVISRFGTMFFREPVAAFANIGTALQPGGRLVMMVWQAAERNEWDLAVRQALAGPDIAGPDPFSLGDPPVVRRILRHAGFTDIALTDVREPVYYGADTDAALRWVRGFAYTDAVLGRLDPAEAERALARLRVALSAHAADDGVWFDSRAWIVSASRRG